MNRWPLLQFSTHLPGVAFVHENMSILDPSLGRPLGWFSVTECVEQRQLTGHGCVSIVGKIRVGGRDRYGIDVVRVVGCLWMSQVGLGQNGLAECFPVEGPKLRPSQKWRKGRLHHCKCAPMFMLLLVPARRLIKGKVAGHATKRILPAPSPSLKLRAGRVH